MTAVIHHGPPGSYKTFSLVQRVVIPALKAGRVVVTNIRGLNNLNAIRDIVGEIPESAAIYYLEPNTDGFDAIARFFHWAPAGALIAMDEGQRVYPTRLRSFDYLDQPDHIVIEDSQGQPLINVETGQPVCRPATLEIAFDQHRHYNWDIYISTPNIGKIHGEIRKVVEWAYRHRNNSGLLPWYKDTWTEFRHDSEQSGKSISHYSGTPKRYKADHRIFNAYQSTATGKAKASAENISIFRDPKLQLMLAVLAICLIFVVWQFGQAYSRVQSNLSGQAIPVADSAPQVDVKKNPLDDRQVSALPARDDSRHNRSEVPSSAVSHVNPFAAGTLYYTGYTSPGLYLFEYLDKSGSYTPVTYQDLMRLGFIVTASSGSFVALDYHGQRILAFTKPRMPQAESFSRVARNDSADMTASLEGIF